MKLFGVVAVAVVAAAVVVMFGPETLVYLDDV